MADAWDDDEWDVPDDDDELDKRLGLKKQQQEEELPTFDDEEDLAIKEAAVNEKLQQAELKKKGTALAAKKRAEKERFEELEIAKRAMELEAEEEQNLSADELKRRKQEQIEDADHALTADLFGAVEAVSNNNGGPSPGTAVAAGDKVVMKDIKDHLKHARKVAECIRGHGKITLALTFLKEVIQECKDVLDDDSISELIKTMNVIKNEKVQAAKRKVKGQAQKSKKVDKVAEAKARQKLVETFGDNDIYDDIDQVANDFEDAFF